MPQDIQFQKSLVFMVKAGKKITNIDLLNQILQDGRINHQEFKSMPALFGYDDVQKCNEEFANWQKNLAEVAKRYNLQKVPAGVLKPVIIKTLKEAGIIRSSSMSMVSPDGMCESIRANCLGAVYAEAAVMHTGCVALDITIPPLGASCHAGAFAYQYFAGNKCNDEYIDCLNKQRGALQ